MPVKVVAKVVAGSWVLACTLGVVSCDCVPDKDPGAESAGETPSSQGDDSDDDDGGGPSTPGGDESGSASSEGGEPSDPAWAMDTFHVFYTEHGETPLFRVEKIQLFPSGKTEQTSLLCGLEDKVFSGTWRAVPGGVVVEPPYGEEFVHFSGSSLSKLVLTETEACEEITATSFRADVEIGGEPLRRGDLCLGCSEVDEFQLQCCENSQPISLCDISACE